MVKITNEIFLQRLQKIHGDKITPLEDYKGGRTRPKMKFHCNVCGNDFECRADQILSGHGCKYCSNTTRANNARKDTNKFISDLEKAHNGKYTLLSAYKGSMHKVHFHCNICNTNFLATPNSILSGHGCPVCARKTVTEKRRISEQEFISRLKEISNDKYTLISDYQGAMHATSFHCNICGNDFVTNPRNLLSDKGCPYCANIKRAACNTKTNETFLQEVKDIHGYKYTVLTPYVKSNKKIKCHCNICNNNFEITPHSLLSGHGCQKCGSVCKTKMTTDELKEKLILANSELVPIENFISIRTKIKFQCKNCNSIIELMPATVLDGKAHCPCMYAQKYEKQLIKKLKNKFNGNIILASKYKNAVTPIKLFCKTCEHTWETTVTSIIGASASGCPNCEKLKQRKDNNTFIKELTDLHPDLIALEDYVNSNTPIKFHCNTCDNDFISTPANILAGHGCRYCHMSYGEKFCKMFLDYHSIDYIQQYKFEDCKDKLPLPFDFAIFSNDKLICVIEYDGKMHLSADNYPVDDNKIRTTAFEYTKKHDAMKNEYCLQHNIPLIRIQYQKEFADMGKRAKLLIFKMLKEQLSSLGMILR